MSDINAYGKYSIVRPIKEESSTSVLAAPTSSSSKDGVQKGIMVSSARSTDENGKKVYYNSGKAIKVEEYVSVHTDDIFAIAKTE